MTDAELTNHEVTICLLGGAVLGPYRATWSKDKPTDVRELTIEYENFLKGIDQKRFKFHLHDTHSHAAHTLILNFINVTGIYDQVNLRV